MSDGVIRSLMFTRRNVGIAAYEAQLLAARSDIQQGIDRENAARAHEAQRQAIYEQKLADDEKRSREIR